MRPLDHSPDDRKRDVTVSFKVTDRMHNDLARLADSENRTPSDLMYWQLRQILYGEIVRLDALAAFPQGKPR